MKKIIVLLLVLGLLLCACGKSEAAPKSETSAESPALSSETAKEPPEEEASLPEPSEEPEEETPPEETETPIEEAPVEEAPAEETPEAPSAPAVTEEPPRAEPYSQKTADTVLEVTGEALDRAYYFTLSDLQNAGGSVEADYFSKGKEPVEQTNRFCGIKVGYLFESVIGLESYKKASFTASDGYGISYGKTAINSAYIDETDAEKSLYMILAWSEDGVPCGLKLVMGQSIEGEYNRTFWVRDVISIEVKAG